MIRTLNYALGAHTPFSKNIYDTLYTSISVGMYTTQFFMGNPKTCNRSKIDQKDIEKSKKLLKTFDLNIFTHFPYICNLAGSTFSLAWEEDEKQNDKTLKVLAGLQYELDVLHELNGKGVVVHPGNYKDRKKGIQAIAKSINKLNFKGDTKLVLENSAGQGVSLATTFQEISDIINLVNPEKRKNIGVCIDTCHIYAFGTYNLSLESEIDKMFSDFDNILGLQNFSLLHLNDSKDVQGAKKDRHEFIGEGKIWSENPYTVIYLLDKCKKYNIPIVLETHMLDILKIIELQK